MTEIARRLTVAENDLLADCEQRIESGLKTFVEVGTALATVRDNRLYRVDHETFEAYVEVRWGLSRAHAYRMISAAEVVSPIGDTGLPLPVNEGQARELARVPEPERAEVWRETVERTEGKPTATAIRETYAVRLVPELTPVDDVAEAIDRHLPPDPDDPHRSWRRSFLADVHAAYRLMSRSTVEEVAERADVECVTELSRAAAELASFAERVRRAVAASTPDNVVQLMRAVK